jgi:sugar phosphate isomerase/epimerase
VTWIETGSTICFKPYPLEDALRGLAAAGFENVEIGAVKGFLEHLDPDDLGPDAIAAARAALDRHGLRCVSLSGHAQLHTEEGRDRLRRVLRAARELDASVLNTFTGDAESDEERAAFVANVRALADEADGLGVRLCIETDSNLIPTAEIGLRILDEIARPSVGINYDPGNVVYYTGADPKTDLRHGLGRLGHVHLKDKRGGEGVFDFPPLGDGELDVESLLRDLARTGFAGPVSLEIEYDGTWPDWETCAADVKRAKAYWDEVAARI